MADAVAPGVQAAQGQPSEKKPTLTLFQANLLVAMLGGFWARQADGHPGPDLLGRGLVILNILVEWERIKQERARPPPTNPGANLVTSVRELPPCNIKNKTTKNKKCASSPTFRR